jgi:hypothetical protein
LKLFQKAYQVLCSWGAVASVEFTDLYKCVIWVSRWLIVLLIPPLWTATWWLSCLYSWIWIASTFATAPAQRVDQPRHEQPIRWTIHLPTKSRRLLEQWIPLRIYGHHEAWHGTVEPPVGGLTLSVNQLSGSEFLQVYNSYLWVQTNSFLLDINIHRLQ